MNGNIICNIKIKKRANLIFARFFIDILIFIIYNKINHI